MERYGIYMSFCSQCGSENLPTAKFCTNCGAKLEQAVGNENIGSGATAFQGTVSSEPSREDGYFHAEPEGEEQPEIHINYGSAGGEYQQYYDGTVVEEQMSTKVSGGNIGVSIAALVCGIISLLCCCTGLFSVVLGIAAVVLGIISLRSHYEGKGMAIAGIVTGGISLFIIVLLLIFSSTAAFSDMVGDMLNDIW